MSRECTKGEQLIVTFAAGYIAGVFCAIVSHPADTVVSKLNQDKGSTAVGVAKKLGFAGRNSISIWKNYFVFFLPQKSVLFRLTSKKSFLESYSFFITGLWKGLTPRIIMIGTLTAAQWFIYDAVKVWLGLPRPPPPEMPESLKKKLAAAQ